MAEVSNWQLNMSLAGQIALNLDKQDEKGQDGKITKSVWDDFWNKNGAEFKGKNENISEEGISVREAMGLIMTRLFNAAKATGKSVDEVAKNLFEKSGGEKIDANTVKFTGEETAPSKEASPVKGVKKPNKSNPAKKKEEDFSKYDTLIRETEEKRDALEKAINRGAWIKGQLTYNVSQIFKYVEGKIKYVDENKDKYNVNKLNVAWTLDKLFNTKGFNPNDKKMQEVVWSLMDRLIERAEELGIKYNKNIIHGSTFKISDKATMTEVKRLINDILYNDASIMQDAVYYKSLKYPLLDRKNGVTQHFIIHSRIYRFDENGRLSQIIDKDGNTVFNRS